MAIANECKKHKEKLKQELKNEIQLKCMKEKEIFEMNEIKEKFAEELEMQVRKEMGLPTTPLSQLPRPMLDIHHHDSPTRVTPSSLLSIKREKLEIADLTDPPPTNTPRGDKWKDTGYVSPAPPTKRFATKQDLQQTFTPSRKVGKSSCTQLFFSMLTKWPVCKRREHIGNLVL